MPKSYTWITPADKELKQLSYQYNYSNHVVENYTKTHKDRFYPETDRRYQDGLPSTDYRYQDEEERQYFFHYRRAKRIEAVHPEFYQILREYDLAAERRYSLKMLSDRELGR